jgi:3'-phosphoadenosine 5'-phosphosulfate sulfotransferase (PAPS reductase)/FAD synthetase
MNSFFDRHEKIALMFSGGRDSIACLHLLKDHLDKVIVIWVNMGANFPEITNLMDGVRQLVPNFLEIQTNQPDDIESNGYPVDMLPISYTTFGQSCTSKKGIKLQSFADCCNKNFWSPCHAKVKELGITGIIRGQRSSDGIRGPIQSGYIEDGIEYFFPIEDWSEQKLLTYLVEQNVVIDERLSMSHSSLDCWNCTAYLNESVDRMTYMKKHHSEKFGEVVKILKRIDVAVKEEANHLQKVLEI